MRCEGRLLGYASGDRAVHVASLPAPDTTAWCATARHAVAAVGGCGPEIAAQLARAGVGGLRVLLDRAVAGRSRPCALVEADVDLAAWRGGTRTAES